MNVIRIFDLLYVQEDKLNALIKAAGVSVEPFWPSLFAKVRAWSTGDGAHKVKGSYLDFNWCVCCRLCPALTSAA